LAKNLKLNIKNTQIAEAINLGSLKSKLAKKKEEAAQEEIEKSVVKPVAKAQKAEAETVKEEAPRIKARSRSAFAEGTAPEQKTKEIEEATDEVESIQGLEQALPAELELEIEEIAPFTSHGEPVQEVAKEETSKEDLETPPAPIAEEPAIKAPSTPKAQEKPILASPPSGALRPLISAKDKQRIVAPPVSYQKEQPAKSNEPYIKLGPTGKHINDLLPPKPAPKKESVFVTPAARNTDRRTTETPRIETPASRDGPKKIPETPSASDNDKKGAKPSLKAKEFKDVKPAKRVDPKSFDARDRHGLRNDDDRNQWRKKRSGKNRIHQEDTTIRPTTLKVRLPIAIKDLAVAMKLKASQLVAKLFLQGVLMTLNDLLDDEAIVQLLGQEFGCDITIDTSEEERIRITDKTVKEEISGVEAESLVTRPPVVAFMGHVDHGKTSLIDAIRKSNRAAGEAGAITQHIGAFRCKTAVGDITVLDTPGHEAFSAMRARGADVTDIVVLVVAGDEGIRQQTLEAIHHAKTAGVTIVVAINKSDKPNFNAETVYRQLSENDLLPESWGGQIITVNCSAVTGEGIQQLLEMLALQAEILELRANPNARARGSVIESEMHKGMGAVATVLVQNGTLKLGDALVFGQHWGRVKTLQDEYGCQQKEASPSTPIEITGLSGMPEAGQDFIVVKSEKEAREIAAVRMQGVRESSLLLKKKVTMENLLQQSTATSKKVLTLVLRADVQGSLEAMKVALMKIKSDKAELNIIFAGVGEISESDVQLAAASKAVILGFHTHVESHAESLIKQGGIQVRQHDIIYHAVDDIRALMALLLDKIAIETEKGKAEVRAVFKSSQVGLIAGCYVIEGGIQRNNYVRVVRNKEILHKGPISSLKRVKEDVREVMKGLECGILLNNFTDVEAGDILEAYEVTYITQEL